MDTLYAFPDDEVVAKLIPGIRDRTLANTEAAARIRQRPGLVPAAVDPAGPGRILWVDIADHRYRDWQFMYTIQRLACADAIGEAFVTDLDILFEDNLFGETLEPAGLVFHVSRCGSTLLAKALARDACNVVVNQGGPLQRGFWSWATNDWRRPLEADAETVHLFRQLVYGMSRPRRAGQGRSFIKFISWNALYAGFIQRAFPGVPALFMYRDPVEVIASVMKETTAALEAKGTRQGAFLSGLDMADMADCSDVAFLAHCYRRYFETALADESGLSYLHYRDLTAQDFTTILRDGLEIAAFGDNVSRMTEQFQFHSKDDTDSTVFRDDVAEKRAALSHNDKRMVNRICGSLLQQLHRSPHNLFVNNESRAPDAVAAECHGDGA